MTKARSNASAPAAKGQIVVGTGTDASGILSVGSNGHTLVADSSETTGLKWQAPAAAGFVGVSLYKSGAQSIANLTNATITFDSENYDTDGFHSTLSNDQRITIPSGKGGKYLISGTMIWASNSTGQRAMKLLKNGTSYYEWCEDDTNSSGILGLSGSIILNLVATDYIEMVASQNSGGTRTVDGGALNTRFDAVYLGA